MIIKAFQVKNLNPNKQNFFYYSLVAVMGIFQLQRHDNPTIGPLHDNVNFGENEVRVAFFGWFKFRPQAKSSMLGLDQVDIQGCKFFTLRTSRTS